MFSNDLNEHVHIQGFDFIAYSIQWIGHTLSNFRDPLLITFNNVNTGDYKRLQE